MAADSILHALFLGRGLSAISNLSVAALDPVKTIIREKSQKLHPNLSFIYQRDGLH
jgi:hypothetical protein